MRIVLVSNFFPPTHTAGTEKRTLGYALKLQELGHEVQVVCAGKWAEGDQYWNGYVDETYQQVPVRRINLNWSLAPDPNRYLYYNPLIKENIGQWMKEWRPDIVHITSCHTLSASVIEAAKRLHLPVVLTLTDFWFICPKLTLLRGDGSLCDGRTTSWECQQCLLWGNKIFRRFSFLVPEAALAKALQWIGEHPTFNKRRGLRGMALDMGHRKSYLRKMLRAVDYVIAPSAYLASRVQASGMTVPIRVIPSGHDLTWLETLPEKKPANLFRFGYLGQIMPHKGVHILISAFLSGSLTERARLDIFGDYGKLPNYTQHLKELAAQNHLNVNFRGSYTYEHLGNVLSEIDVLVIPSQWHENNPRVIQEAFASKVPVIASNVGGISEFVKHEVNGLLFERNDTTDLAQQMERLVEQTELLDQLRSGIPPVKTIAEEVNELESIYWELTSLN